MICFLKNLIKCFGVCGCSANGQCINCNSTYFIGYDTPGAGRIPSSSLPTTSPNTNGASCSLNTEYTDVSKINLIKKEEDTSNYNQILKKKCKWKQVF